MRDIAVRYGARVPLTVTIDDEGALTAELYVGKPGAVAVITKSASFVDGSADLSLEGTDTEVPLDEYNYQVNVTYATGGPDKFPDPNNCDSTDNGLPSFTVVEALDEAEVS